MTGIRLKCTDPVLSLVIARLQDQTLNQCQLKTTDPPELWQFLRVCNHLKLRRGILYRKILLKESQETLFQLVLPAAHRETALKGSHKEVGHLGLEHILNLMCDPFLWPCMVSQVREHIDKCQPCLTFKAKQPRAPLESIVATHPLELVHLDYLSLEPGMGKEENALVVTDHFTQYIQAYVTQSQTALTRAKTLWDNFIVHYGLPKKILSDQGRNFKSELITYLCRLMGTQKLQTGPYHLQTNSQCERFISTLIDMLGTLSPEWRSDWKSSIGALVHTHNCTRNSATGFSPYFLMYGRQPCLPINVTMPTSTKYVQTLREHIRWAHRNADRFQQKEVWFHK